MERHPRKPLRGMDFTDRITYIPIEDRRQFNPPATNAAHVDIPPAPTGNTQEDFRCDYETDEADPPS